MRGAYIAKRDITLRHTQGVNKKIYAQNEAFKFLGAKMDLFHIRKDSIYKNDIIIGAGINGFLRNIKKNHLFYTSVAKEVNEELYDFVYIRYSYATPLFIKFLKKIKTANPNLIVIVEIPTFPYQGEMRGLKKSILKRIDNKGIGDLKKYVDRIVTFYGQKDIFGIKTITLGNGIDTSKIEILPRKKSKKDKEITLVTVANLKFFHAYDRVIKGIANNTSEYTIRFNVVGPGPELDVLKRLTKDLQVEHLVTFYGYKHGKELKNILTMSDIAVGTLGMHRKGLHSDSSLKTREYCASGIPFILSSPDPDFGETFEYQLKIPENDDPLDISTLVEFYEKLQGKNYTVALHQYAIENLDWKVQLKKVEEFISIKKNASI